MDENADRGGARRRRDVVVVGGGAAGLAAALQLGRSRRSVTVIDAGEPRNAPAAHMHSYLGHEGRPPGEFLAIGRDEVQAYGVELVEGAVTAVTALTLLEEGTSGIGFEVSLADGSVVTARRVLMATGLVDELADIDGLAAQWGRGVLHCPYCHGWEVRDQRIVVIATSALVIHQALLFRQLSDRVTVVDHAGVELADEDRDRLAARGIPIVEGPVARLAVEGDPATGTLTGVDLADGTTIEADAVVVAPRFVARTDLLRPLGISPSPAPMGTGEALETDQRGATSVPGLYAAGNVADVSHQVLQAAAEGSRTGAQINADLVMEDADLAVAATRPPGDGAADWDERYRAVDQWWSGSPNASLVAEAAALTPGAALDVGCGEGGDAVWLAQQGWKVTALDISRVALDRTGGAAADAGVAVELAEGDVAVDPPEPGGYDLVSVHYPALRHAPGDPAIHALIDAVAPGGTLLVVGHDLAAVSGDGTHGHEGKDPADYVQPPDVVRLLGPDWTVDVDESRPRVLPPGSATRDVPDRVLRARRGIRPRTS